MADRQAKYLVEHAQRVAGGRPVRTESANAHAFANAAIGATPLPPVASDAVSDSRRLPSAARHPFRQMDAVRRQQACVECANLLHKLVGVPLGRRKTSSRIHSLACSVKIALPSASSLTPVKLLITGRRSMRRDNRLDSLLAFPAFKHCARDVYSAARNRAVAGREISVFSS